jgi:hypothetical protein
MPTLTLDSGEVLIAGNPDWHMQSLVSLDEGTGAIKVATHSWTTNESNPLGAGFHAAVAVVFNDAAGKVIKAIRAVYGVSGGWDPTGPHDRRDTIADNMTPQQASQVAKIGIGLAYDPKNTFEQAIDQFLQQVSQDAGQFWSWLTQSFDALVKWLMSGALGGSMYVRSPEAPWPPVEPCAFVPGATYQEPGQEGRLLEPLRNAAKTKNATEILTQAAIAQCEALLNPSGFSLARPLADLAVTGRMAFSDFCSTQPQDGQIQANVHSRIGTQAGVTSMLIAESVKEVLDRAYSVAWFLRGRSARGELGWIAVSSEDDPPHRPVNATATM